MVFCEVAEHDKIINYSLKIRCVFQKSKCFREYFSGDFLGEFVFFNNSTPIQSYATMRNVQYESENILKFLSIDIWLTSNCFKFL